ncbi:BTB/POZ domain-containing protein [Ditylenchus destructor]|nr:BTB/POZ domain-containing protein [Ditylenchus destructor]
MDPRKFKSFAAAKRKQTSTASKSTKDIGGVMESLISKKEEPLQDKEKFAKKEDVFNDFSQHYAKDVTFLVKSVPILGDRKYLAEISPVFDKMLNGKFAEANQQEIELKDINPDSFKDFLMATWRKPIMPTSANIVELLKLADRFDVASLRDNCENHLKVSTEIPLIDRLILSQNYRLETLQDFLVNQINADVWLEWQKSENWLEKIGALTIITVSRITTNLALELERRDREISLKAWRRDVWPVKWTSFPFIGEKNTKGNDARVDAESTKRADLNEISQIYLAVYLKYTMKLDAWGLIGVQIAAKKKGPPKKKGLAEPSHE